jgi:hypothetical protein
MRADRARARSAASAGQIRRGDPSARSAYAWCVGTAVALISLVPTAEGQHSTACRDQLGYDELYAQVVHGIGVCDDSVGCAPQCRQAQNELRDHPCFADYLQLHSCESHEPWRLERATSFSRPVRSFARVDVGAAARRPV